MVRIAVTRPFTKSVKKLPGAQHVKLSFLLKELSRDPFSPILHSKPLTGALTGKYSFRINREWRVIFRFRSPNEISLIRAIHRKDAYR